MAGISPTALFRAFSGGDHADFRITCGQREFNVHKMIICADSHYFQSVCKGNFEEQDSVELKEEEPDIIEKVLHFLYFGSYHDDNQYCNADFHKIVHPLATLYNSESIEPQFKSLKSLKGLHRYDQNDATVGELHTTIKLYQSADMLGIEPLKLVTVRKIIDMMANNADASFLGIVLETLFSTVPDDSLLRNAVIDACVHNYNRVTSIPKVVALLEEHEARIWRLARQNYTTHLRRIEHYVRETIVSTSKKRRCDAVRHGAKCECYVLSTTNSQILDEDGAVSASARCKQCGSEFSFVVQP